jgi:hypothetical protein
MIQARATGINWVGVVAEWTADFTTPEREVVNPDILARVGGVGGSLHAFAWPSATGSSPLGAGGRAAPAGVDRAGIGSAPADWRSEQSRRRCRPTVGVGLNCRDIIVKSSGLFWFTAAPLAIIAGAILILLHLSRGPRDFLMPRRCRVRLGDRSWVKCVGGDPIAGPLANQPGPRRLQN